MTTWARIRDGVVLELFDLPPEWADKTPADLFHPDIGDWIDVTSVDPKPAYGWTHDGSRFDPPPADNAGEARLEWARKLVEHGIIRSG